MASDDIAFATASDLARMIRSKQASAVEVIDGDLEPAERIWFAYSSAMWNARFRDRLPTGATGCPPA
ncbi:MAG TPA: hypothetical protein VG758_05515 [Hyphomicrobiaceae bacterium]|jgi:hypothetical protein|nr:hypothetical protein [Hyphomicrobiaceae bacterium]